jgi:hypothetical protein
MAAPHHTVNSARSSPTAPPAYRPQPVPKVLQRKTASPGQQPDAGRVGHVPANRPTPLHGMARVIQRAVIQCQCNHCNNVMCDNGSVCGGTKKRKAKYEIGQHGSKTKEQKRLSGKFGITVSGETFESEHTIGFEPLNQSSNLKRGSSGRARTLENKAAAYQEVKELHRDHIGTGTTNDIDESGLNSEQYRKTQRSLIESKDISSAVQINQLAYAFDPNFKKAAKTQEGKAANDSFNVMVGGMNSFTYAKDVNDVTVEVDLRQKAEMLVARLAAQQGTWPTPEQIGEIYEQVGMDDYWG